MSIAKKVYRFLQVDIYCAYCGKALELTFGKKEPNYLKMKMFPQSPWGSWRWFKQVMAGDDYVLRFCNMQEYKEFASKGRLVEIIPEKSLIHEVEGEA